MRNRSLNTEKSVGVLKINRIDFLAKDKFTYRNEEENVALFQMKDFVQRQRPQIISFDIFDTALWRTVRNPSDLFVEFGRIILEEGLVDGVGSPESFGAIRSAAERRAREKQKAIGNQLEASLYEIYESIVHINGVDIHRCVELEIKSEIRHLRPDPLILEFYEWLKIIDIPVIFVSDTYFEQMHLTRILKEIFSESIVQEQVFSSVTHRIAKKGGLLAKAATCCGVNAANILHVGDNFEADIDGAKSVGAMSLHYQQYKDLANYYFSGENHVANMMGVSTSSSKYDFSIDSQRRHIHNYQYGLQRKLNSAESLATFTIGPILAGFVEWTVANAKLCGLKKLFCMTREGLFLAELINRYSEKTGASVIAYPFLSSRSVTYPTIFKTVSLEELQNYFHSRRSPMTAANFLKRIGRPDLIRIVDRSLHHTPLYPENSMEVLLSFASSPEIRTAILSWSKLARQNLANYMDAFAKETELSASEPIGFVDLGWTTRSQRILEDALHSLGYTNPTIGLYLATDRNAAYEAALGVKAYGFLFENGEPFRLCHPILRCKEILEQVCSADVGSVRGYTDNGEVIFDKHISNPCQSEFLQTLRNSVRSFLHAYLHLANYFENYPKLSQQEDALRLILARLTMYPSQIEISEIGSWAHEENNESERSEKIVDSYFEAIAAYATPQQINELDIYWTFALVLKARPAVYYEIYGLTTGLQPAEEPHWNAARFMISIGANTQEDIQGDYYMGSEGRGISYCCFSAAKAPNIVWHNYGFSERVIIEKVLHAVRDCRTNVVTRLEICKPALVCSGGHIRDNGHVMVDQGASILIAADHLLDGPYECSVILCLSEA